MRVANYYEKRYPKIALGRISNDDVNILSRLYMNMQHSREKKQLDKLLDCKCEYEKGYLERYRKLCVSAVPPSPLGSNLC